MGAIYNKGGTEKAGDIKYCAANAIPAGWLKCNGAAINRVAYSALFAVIGTTYGAGDGVSTFNVPEFRGEFLRCLDDGRGVDSTRALGAAQAANVASHTHQITPVVDTAGGATGNGFMYFSGSATGNQQAGGLPTGASGSGTDTRPRNQAVLAVIKY